MNKSWKYCQELINNTYHGGHIETDNHFICSIPEDVADPFAFPNFTTPVKEILREVLDNDTTPRDKISLNGLGMKKVEFRVVSIMLKTGMEVDQYYTVFNYINPIPQKNVKHQDGKNSVRARGEASTKICSPRA